MSVHTTRRPAVVLAVAALLTAGFAAPASASPWSDAWSRFSGWFAHSSLGALWADRAPRQVLGNEGVSINPAGRPSQAPRGGSPRQVVGNEGVLVDPNGRPALVNGEGMLIDPSGAPRP